MMGSSEAKQWLNDVRLYSMYDRHFLTPEEHDEIFKEVYENEEHEKEDLNKDKLNERSM